MLERLELLKKGFAFPVQAAGSFWRDESGQDLIEYTLLLAFVALSSAALFTNAGTSVSKVWSSANTTLSTAALKAAS
ncbi:MAG: Flp family type IVb pilin [Bryobacteraceae bacterium]|jgi:Flp pilus assembly pilin Flp